MAVIDDKTENFHKRLGHMSKKGLEVLLERDELPGLKSLDLELSEHCLYGKKIGRNFLRIGHEMKSSPLELVHFLHFWSYSGNFNWRC